MAIKTTFFNYVYKATQNLYHLLKAIIRNTWWTNIYLWYLQNSTRAKEEHGKLISPKAALLFKLY